MPPGRYLAAPRPNQGRCFGGGPLGGSRVEMGPKIELMKPLMPPPARRGAGALMGFYSIALR